MTERVCSEDGCERPVRARGWCSSHYMRWYKEEAPKGAAESFWNHVDKSPEGCWLWTGPLRPKDGYGVWRSGPAHRAAFLSAGGSIPDGYQIDHLCRVRNCVNPAHLEAVTPQENIRRSMCPPALNAQKTHCPQGHPYDEVNTYVRVVEDGGRWRECRACHRISYSEWRTRQRNP